MINKLNKRYHSFYIDNDLLTRVKEVAWVQRKSFNQFLVDALETAAKVAEDSK